MRPVMTLFVLSSLSLLTACKSTTELTTSWQAVEVPPKARLIDPVTDEVKAEPAQPVLPPAGVYGASNTRAEKLGLYAVELRKWGRGLVAAVEKREAAALALYQRQQQERAAALARLKALREDEE